MEAKILQINETTIIVGYENGTTKKFDRSNFNFNPKVDDKVEFFGDEDNLIISKSERNREENTGSQTVYVNVTQNQSNGKKVNKLAYCLLAFFFGGLGIHQLYAGKTFSGVMMLIFCWTFIPSVIAFVQFFMALFIPSDENGMITL